MQRGRTAGRQPPLPKTFEELLEHPRQTYREVARALLRYQPANVNAITDHTGFTLGTVQGVVTQLKRANLIHVARWEKPTPRSWLAAYAVGAGEDAVREVSDRRNRKKVAEPEPANRWQDVMRALVPKRTPEQIAEVNRLYLNWISEGMYG